MDINLKESYKGKRVLVTGHTGFKGSWLSIWLKSLGAEVIGYSLEAHTEPSMFKVCNLESKITSIIGDIRDYSKLHKVIKEYKPDIIFHLAAQALVRHSYKNPIETYETNIMGTVNLLEAAKNSESVKSIVIVTTDKCYENKEWIYGYRETDPMGGYDPYSSSKGCTELIVSSYRNSFYREKGIALASARAGNVIGGGDWSEDRLIPDFVRSVLKKEPIIIRTPSATRPWQHVLEPLSGYLLLCAKMLKNKEKYSSAWNFGPKETDVLSVKEILNLCIKTWGRGSFNVEKNNNLHEASLLKLDISKARTILNWNPVYDIKKAVEETICWYKEFDKYQIKNMYDYTLMQIQEYEKETKSKN